MKLIKARHFTILTIMIVVSTESIFTSHGETANHNHVDAPGNEHAATSGSHNNSTETMSTAKKATLLEQAKAEATRATEKAKEFASKTGTALGIPSLGILEKTRQDLNLKQSEPAKSSAQSEKAPSRTYLQFTTDKINDAASYLFGSGKTHETVTGPNGRTLVTKSSQDGSYEITDTQGLFEMASDGKKIKTVVYEKDDSLPTKKIKIEREQLYDKNTGTTTKKIKSGYSSGTLIEHDPQVSVSDVYDNQGRKIKGVKQEITIKKTEVAPNSMPDVARTRTEIMTKIYHENNPNEPITTKVVTRLTTTDRGETIDSTVNEVNHPTTNTINYYDATGKLINNGTQRKQAYFEKENKNLVIDTNTTNQPTNTVPTTLKPVDISKIPNVTNNKPKTSLAKNLQELKEKREAEKIPN